MASSIDETKGKQSHAQAGDSDFHVSGADLYGLELGLQ